MDVNKLRFAELLKKERHATKVLIEALLEIHGGCINPSGDDEDEDDKHDCSHCVFENGHSCAKLFLDYWLSFLKGKK
jgi:hypothetical protein